jgi:toxin ParE1/3/4
VTQYRLAAPARTQIAHILAWSAADFGDVASRNYGLLLVKAMQDVATVPDRPGAQRLRRFPGILVYEIRHSKNRVPRGNRVRNPWHKLIYTQGSDGVVEILAVVGLPYPSGRAAREALAGR